MATIFDLIALGIMDFFGWYAQEILGGPDLLVYFARQLAMSKTSVNHERKGNLLSYLICH